MYKTYNTKLGISICLITFTKISHDDKGIIHIIESNVVILVTHSHCIDYGMITETVHFRGVANATLFFGVIICKII